MTSVVEEVQGSYICPKTGLALVSASGQKGWRLAKSSYGPMNPMRREAKVPRLQWGRFDVLGGRTIYAGSSPQAAYGESIAFARMSLDYDLSEFFDDEDDETLQAAVEAEWSERNHMLPGALPKGWRQERLLHSVSLPDTGWFVDIERAESISAIGNALRSELSFSGISNLDVSNLRGTSRALTTNIAQWVRDQVLDDGSLPHGIKFGSKHDSTWSCWAIWLRKLDDGHPISAEPTWADEGIAIEEPARNPELAEVCSAFGLRCW